jgi:hypothetical protein
MQRKCKDITDKIQSQDRRNADITDNRGAQDKPATSAGQLNGEKESTWKMKE